MKLTNVKDWKAIHFDKRTILQSDKLLYSPTEWSMLISTIEVVPMKQPGHYRVIND